MIEINHDREQGTLVAGTAKGDGTGPILHAAGFRFSRTLDAWYVPHSRRRAAKTWIINAAAEQLREAGHEVTVTIDDTTPAATPFAEHEAAGYERAQDRADRYAERAERATGHARALEADAKERASAIPFGQPILINHHSEQRDRRERERIGRKFDKSAQEAGRGRYWQGRAQAAQGYRSGRENLGVTLRRIEKLEADRRRIERDMAATADEGYRERRAADLAETDEQLAYWRAFVAEAEANGAKVWSREDFTKGDYVRFHRTWWEVLRVNEKTLTIPHSHTGIGEPIMSKERAQGRRMGAYTDKVPYDKVTGRMSAAEAAPLLAATAEPEE
ncbi:DUF3560 domain-containing protein [Nocardiopsis changdeensis]|uniref:DUF3560 domain-containing protein n=1 Tax=Nocardiopsis changdeensis TaxID=2831969 RepID=A0A975QCG0_9ACTN|nr:MULTISPECIES: DUF3560 domain-containing protein [Nocardiopsis]QUX26442.1 DUF3560 domain-containing protein [Nocardiopsis changdeensis]QYX40714.1 DUF3560 domain-containing protein [Nocardiopsis sp. MT53]